MKHLLIALLVWAMAAVYCSGQSAVRQVTGAGGGEAVTAAGSLEWTLGETAISPRTANGLHWSEGFQQVWTAPVVSTNAPENTPAISFSVYPNPATDYLNITTSVPLDMEIFDLAGRSVHAPFHIENQVQTDLLLLPSGFYLLRATDRNGHLAGVAKIRIVR